MPLKLNSTGGGSVTLDTPSTASAYTLTVPAATATLATTTGTLTNPTINGFTGDTSVINVGSGQFYKDTSGNVGIGTTSPGSKLSIATGSVRVDDDYQFEFGGTRNSISGSNSANYLKFWTNNSLRMVLDSSGNLGLGFTPDGNYIFQTSRDGGKGANINTFAMGKSGGDYAWAGYNFAPTASSGVYNYSASDYASAIRYGQAGAIQVFTAAYGTGGTTITWASGPYVALSGTSWTSSSDERLKNITGLITDAISKVKQLRAAEFTWKNDSTNKPQVGLIAQDVIKVLPEAVDTKTDPDAFGVSYTEVIPLLVAAIQEQQTLIEALTARIAALEAK